MTLFGIGTVGGQLHTIEVARHIQSFAVLRVLRALRELPLA
jgi:hypothetical protein